jgi:hypothetical protein
MKEDVRRILDEYEKGRITATGLILDLLSKVNHADLKEALESLPVNLVERLSSSFAHSGDVPRASRPAFLGR